MFVLNEKVYAEMCLREGIVDKNPYQAISILAKYFYHCCKFKPKKICELLLDYLKEYYPKYELNEEQWIASIEKLATNSKKWTLYEFTGVKITKKEIEVIKSIKNKSLEKLAFTSLCLAKLHNLKNKKNNSWVNTSTSEIFKVSRISCSAYEQDVKLNKLYILGLIDFPKKNDNLNYRVTFCDNEGEEELFISDFRELGYEYLSYLGEKFIHCSECGILTPPGDTNRKKYCDRHKSDRAPMIEKVITCVDCGKKVEISSKNNRTVRCDDCKRIYRNNYQKELMRKNMLKDKNLAQQI